MAGSERSRARSSLYADGKLVILDEDGTLGLATVTPEGLQVLAQRPVLENLAWTPPTLVGTKLYARDRKNIAASSSVGSSTQDTNLAAFRCLSWLSAAF